jgi:hypothetical protein
MQRHTLLRGRLAGPRPGQASAQSTSFAVTAPRQMLHQRRPAAVMPRLQSAVPCAPLRGCSGCLAHSTRDSQQLRYVLAVTPCNCELQHQRASPAFGAESENETALDLARAMLRITLCHAGIIAHTNYCCESATWRGLCCDHKFFCKPAARRLRRQGSRWSMRSHAGYSSRLPQQRWQRPPSALLHR